MITVYSSFKSSRLEYILNFIFKNILEIDFKWTQDYTNLDGVVLNYSDEILPCQNYQIQPSGFLVDGNWDFKKYIFFESFPFTLYAASTRHELKGDIWWKCFYLQTSKTRAGNILSKCLDNSNCQSFYFLKLCPTFVALALCLFSKYKN